jgi:hypothetical protein
MGIPFEATAWHGVAGAGRAAEIGSGGQRSSVRRRSRARELTAALWGAR